MKVAIYTLLSAAFCALVTSCYYPPSYPEQPNQPVAPPAPVDNTTATDPGAQQLQAARERLEAQQNGTTTNPYNAQLPTTDPNAVAAPTAPATYPYATKVPNKPGFVFNPYTKNQVDVRGIPGGTLVRDPYDNDKTHKFRVP